MHRRDTHGFLISEIQITNQAMWKSQHAQELAGLSLSHLLLVSSLLVLIVNWKVVRIQIGNLAFLLPYGKRIHDQKLWLPRHKITSQGLMELHKKMLWICRNKKSFHQTSHEKTNISPKSIFFPVSYHHLVLKPLNVCLQFLFMQRICQPYHSDSSSLYAQAHLALPWPWERKLKEDSDQWIITTS